MSTSLNHVAVWFEIPTIDLDRAMHFYGTVLQTTFREENMGPMQMAVFSHDEQAVGGALVKAAHMQPSASGTVVYLNAGPALQPVLDRVPAAGGTIIVPKTLISPEIGYFAVVRDTEGNHVGFHALD